MLDTFSHACELKVVEQSYLAVLEVRSGVAVTDVAERYGCPASRCTPGLGAIGRGTGRLIEARRIPVPTPLVGRPTAS